MISLRDRLVALTAAIETRAEGDEITLDAGSGEVRVRSRLDDAEETLAVDTGCEAVPTPDGLWEWGVRRDFVRSLPPGHAKRRLAACLGGPRTRRRFASVLAASKESELLRAFSLFRRRQVRRWAAGVLRARALACR